MSEKIVRIGLKRLPGFLYYVDKQGNVSKTPSAKGVKGKKGSQIVFHSSVRKEVGFLYFLDKDGDVSRAKLARKKKVA